MSEIVNVYEEPDGSTTFELADGSFAFDEFSNGDLVDEDGYELDWYDADTDEDLTIDEAFQELAAEEQMYEDALDWAAAGMRDIQRLEGRLGRELTGAEHEAVVDDLVHSPNPDAIASYVDATGDPDPNTDPQARRLLLEEYAQDAFDRGNAEDEAEAEGYEPEEEPEWEYDWDAPSTKELRDPDTRKEEIMAVAEANFDSDEED